MMLGSYKSILTCSLFVICILDIWQESCLLEILNHTDVRSVQARMDDRAASH